MPPQTQPVGTAPPRRLPQPGESVFHQGRRRVVDAFDPATNTVTFQRIGPIRDTATAPERETRIQEFFADPPDIPLLGQPVPGELEEEGPGRLQRFGRAAVAAFDPRTTEGRQNIAGEVGAIAGAALIGGPIGTAIHAGRTINRAVRVARILAPGVGAFAGASVMSGVERGVRSTIGAPPPEPSLGAQLFGVEGDSPIADVLVGAEQASYEFGATATIWPIRAVIRRFAARTIAEAAVKGLKVIRTEMEDVLSAASRRVTVALKDLRAFRAQGLREVRNVGREATIATRTAARAGVDVAQETAATGLRAAQAAATEGTAAATSRLVGIAPGATPTEAGEAALQVLRGPAQQVRDQLGRQIDEVAQQGPDLDITDIKAAAQEVFDTEIRDAATSFSGVALDSGAEAQLASLFSRATTQAEQTALTEALTRAGVSTEAIEATIATAKHPAMGVLRRIFNAPDTVPFPSAHQLKKEFTEQIGPQGFQQLARPKTLQLLKKFRGQLNQALGAAFTPYRTANEAFGAVARLMDSGIAPELQRQALTNPDVLLKLIKPDEPVKLRLFRDLLLDVSGQAGEAGRVQGVAAWDMLRSAWTHRRINRGVGAAGERGIEGLGKRLDNLADDPDFMQIMYGDETGKAMLANLRQISEAFQTAKALGEAGIQAATEAGAAGVRAMTQTGQEAVEQVARSGRAAVETTLSTTARPKRQLEDETTAIARVRELLTRPSRAELDLAESTLAEMQNAEGVVTNLTRALFLEPAGTWQIVSSLRLIRGAKGPELIRWASHSSRSTQLLVGALTSPTPGMFIAQLIRTDGFAEFFINPMITAREAQVVPERQSAGTRPQDPQGLSAVQPR